MKFCTFEEWVDAVLDVLVKKTKIHRSALHHALQETFEKERSRVLFHLNGGALPIDLQPRCFARNLLREPSHFSRELVVRGDRLDWSQNKPAPDDPLARLQAELERKR